MVGTIAESSRLLLIQTLLKGGGGSLDGKVDEEEAARQRGIAGMSPLVGLYYFAPVCALLNGFVALLVEMPWFDAADLYRVEVGTLALNSVVAFMLNVAGVFLVSASQTSPIQPTAPTPTHSLTRGTDRPNISTCNESHRDPQVHHTRRRVSRHLGDSGHIHPAHRLRDRAGRDVLLLAPAGRARPAGTRFPGVDR